MRCFLALVTPADVLQGLAAAQDDLSVGHLVPEDDMHLTLAFLGDVRPDSLDDVALDLEMLRPGPQRVEVVALDTFGSDEPRSLHARVASDPGLVHLQGKVATIVRRAGILLPHRRFVPHVTLARFSRAICPDDHRRLGRFLSTHGGLRLPPGWTTDLGLYRSTLTEDGARYDLLDMFPLG